MKFFFENKIHLFLKKGSIHTHDSYGEAGFFLFCFHSKRIVHSGRVRFKCDDCDAYSYGIAFQVFILHWGENANEFVIFFFRSIRSNRLNISTWLYDRIYKSYLQWNFHLNEMLTNYTGLEWKCLTWRRLNSMHGI